jgi:hypothetical protein
VETVEQLLLWYTLLEMHQGTSESIVDIPEQLLCIDLSSASQLLPVDLALALPIVQSLAGLRQVTHAALSKPSLHKPLHGAGAEHKDAGDATQHSHSLQVAQHGLTAAALAVARVHCQAANLSSC